ncbi:MAG: hypothetical protein HY306_01815 [Nitrosomonadales bacterium]|nr:hypothetical protein [Nitrosomonadales bacterium]
MEVFLLIVAVLLAIIIFGKLKGDLDIGKLDIAGLKREIWVTQNWINNYHKGGCPPKYHEKFQYKLLRLEQANTQLDKLTSNNTVKSGNAGYNKPSIDIDGLHKIYIDFISDKYNLYSTKSVSVPVSDLLMIRNEVNELTNDGLTENEAVRCVLENYIQKKS